MNELILERPKHLWQPKNFRVVVGKLPDALVQLEQSERQCRMRANNSLLRCLRKLTADYCLSSGIQIVNRKRHCSIVKVRCGSLMYDIEAVRDDVAGQNLLATVQEG